MLTIINVLAVEASFVKPFLSPIERSNSMSALRSPAFSKLSRAKSKRQVASARSPMAFHFASASSSGTCRAISTARSRSSSCSDRSNFWSRSVVTSRASSLRPRHRRERRLDARPPPPHTSSLQEGCYPIALLLGYGGQYLGRCIHVAPQYCCLVLNE